MKIPTLTPSVINAIRSVMVFARDRADEMRSDSEDDEQHADAIDVALQVLVDGGFTMEDTKPA